MFRQKNPPFFILSGINHARPSIFCVFFLGKCKVIMVKPVRPVAKMYQQVKSSGYLKTIFLAVIGADYSMQRIKIG